MDSRSEMCENLGGNLGTRETCLLRRFFGRKERGEKKAARIFSRNAPIRCFSREISSFFAGALTLRKILARRGNEGKGEQRDRETNPYRAN